MQVLGINSKRFKAHYVRDKYKNGAYWYAREIEDNIIPNLSETHVQLVTAGASLYRPNDVMDGAIVVCHDNRSTLKSYKRLLNKDILWITCKQSTRDLLIEAGENATYVPLSIDTEYVKQFKRDKDRDIAFVGNAWGFKRSYIKSLSDDVEQLSGLPREQLLEQMAHYKRVIAEGRCLMEAQVLGAVGEVPQYENLTAEFVEPLDNRDTIHLWDEAIQTHMSKRCIMKTMRMFKDLQANRTRRAGEVFSVTNKRAKELLSNELNLVKEL